MLRVGNNLENKPILRKTQTFHTKMTKFKFVIDQTISKSQSGIRKNKQYLLRLPCYIHRNPLVTKNIHMRLIAGTKNRADM